VSITKNCQIGIKVSIKLKIKMQEVDQGGKVKYQKLVGI